MKTAMKTLLRLSGVILLLAAGSSVAASGAPPGGAIERFGNDRSQDEDLTVPEGGGRDPVVCRYRSLAGNCVRPMLADPSDCLIVKSSKAGIPIKRRNRVW